MKDAIAAILYFADFFNTLGKECICWSLRAVKEPGLGSTTTIITLSLDIHGTATAASVVVA